MRDWEGLVVLLGFFLYRLRELIFGEGVRREVMLVGKRTKYRFGGFEVVVVVVRIYF